MKDVYILGGSRTPQGSFMGELSTVTAPELGAVAIEGALKNANIEKTAVEHVYMGEVIQAGVGQAPARQAAIFAGLNQSVPCVTINKVCGSGMEAVIQAARTIMVDGKDIIVAGGMENMSIAPHLMPASRTGIKFGEGKLIDSMQNDGLRDVYTDRPMGNCAEECARKYEFSREQQDAYSIESFKRAQKAQDEGIFDSEISKVTVKTRKGDLIVKRDSGPTKVDFDKLPKLRPAFEKDGTITAANASSINDGAAAIVLGSEKYKDQAVFKIISWEGFATDPTWFTIAPVEAMKKCLKKANLKTQDIGLFEINEAFAVVTMAAIKELSLEPSKVNIYGGGISLGHPIGTSGARILITLMNGMQRNNTKYGLASLCIGGGEALSMIIEKL